jgi:hypothetical protein
MQRKKSRDITEDAKSLALMRAHRNRYGEQVLHRVPYPRRTLMDPKKKKKKRYGEHEGCALGWPEKNRFQERGDGAHGAPALEQSSCKARGLTLNDRGNEVRRHGTLFHYTIK